MQRSLSAIILGLALFITIPKLASGSKEPNPPIVFTPGCPVPIMEALVSWHIGPYPSPEKVMNSLFDLADLDTPRGPSSLQDAAVCLSFLLSDLKAGRLKSLRTLNDLFTVHVRRSPACTGAQRDRYPQAPNVPGAIVNLADGEVVRGKGGNCASAERDLSKKIKEAEIKLLGIRNPDCVDTALYKRQYVIVKPEGDLQPAELCCLDDDGLYHTPNWQVSAFCIETKRLIGDNK